MILYNCTANNGPTMSVKFVGMVIQNIENFIYFIFKLSSDLLLNLPVLFIPSIIFTKNFLIFLIFIIEKLKKKFLIFSILSLYAFPTSVIQFRMVSLIVICFKSL